MVPSVPRRLATPRNPRNLDVFKLESFGTQIKIQFSVLLIMNSIGLWPFVRQMCVGLSGTTW